MEQKNLTDLIFKSVEGMYFFPVTFSQYSPSPSTLSSSVRSTFTGVTIGSFFQSFGLLVAASLVGKIPEFSTLGYLTLIPLATNCASGIWEYARKNKMQLNPASIAPIDYLPPSPSSSFSHLISSSSQPLFTYNPTQINTGFSRDEIGRVD
ncbi:MAG: hypothetical protein AABX16_04200 [Nanoarchaeota archaeon]